MPDTGQKLFFPKKKTTKLSNVGAVELIVWISLYVSFVSTLTFLTQLTEINSLGKHTSKGQIIFFFFFLALGN